MLKRIILSIFIFVILFFTTSIYAETIFDSNKVDCSGSIIICDDNFNHIKFGDAIINNNHEIIFNGNWVRVNYLTHLLSEKINISTDIKAVDGSYEMSINTPASVYNSYYSARITFVSGVAELWTYKMDPYGNNYSNLVENPPRDDVSVILGPIENNRYYHFQTIYDGNLLKIFFDESLIFSKSILFIDNYYNVAFMSRSNAPWKNLLITTNLDGLEPTNSPTPTNTPTPLPTLTPTTIPVATLVPNREKIILIPGTFASWNREAMLHNKKVDQENWSILPFVNEYKGIIETLKNLGYKENEGFYIFAYDWRKPIKEIIKDLDIYIKRINYNDEKINIIGHSLGGLVGRSYIQTYSDNKIKKLIMVGSPNNGAAQVYKVVEAGDLQQDNSWLWLSQKVILQLYRDGIKTDRQIIRDSFPIAYDLLPTVTYLKNSSGKEKNISLMVTKNDYLTKVNSSVSSIFDKFSTIGGKGIDTISGYFITDNTPLDRLLGNYIDGRPYEAIYDKGDGLILRSSAIVGVNPIELDYHNHGEIIYKKSAIKEILESLGVSYSDDQIVEGKGTTISPSLIFMIKSPASLEVKRDGNSYLEHDGIVFIENAKDGNYKLLVKGKERGRYEIIVGEIKSDGSYWSQIQSEITSLIPQLEEDEYDIDFKIGSFSSHFINMNSPLRLIDELIVTLKQKEKSNKEIIKDLGKVKEYYRQKKFNKIPDMLLDQNEDMIEKKEYLALEKLENIYSILVKVDNKQSRKINNRFNSSLKKFHDKQNSLISKNKNIEKKLIILELTKKRFEDLLGYLDKGKLSYSEIMLESINNLIEKL